MTTQLPEALQLAFECEESATHWVNEIDTRAKAARMLRAQHARIAELEARIAHQAAPPFGWLITKSKLPGDVEFTQDPTRENLARSFGHQTQALYAQPAAQGMETHEFVLGVVGLLPDPRDGEFFRWLTGDHESAETRIACASLIGRMSVMSTSAVRAYIANAIAAQAKQGEQAK